MALPDASAHQSAAGKARMALPDAGAAQSAGGKAGRGRVTAKQLPGGPCPCTHPDHEGGKCGTGLSCRWMAGGWCASCYNRHRPQLKAQGMALQRAVTDYFKPQQPQPQQPQQQQPQPQQGEEEGEEEEHEGEEAMDLCSE
jgi:hypothetical protein